MATQLAPLWVRVGADIKGYQAGMAKVQTQAKATGRAVALASKLAAGALIGIGIAALKAGADMQNATAIIRRGTAATGDALQGLKKDFDAVFGTVPEDAEKVATAIADLNTRLGLTGEPLQRMSKLFLDFARITEEDVGETIRRTTRVFGDWSVATEKQEETMNLLLRASQNSGLAVSELTGKMVQFGAPLRTVGFTIEDTIALLAKWEKEGVNVEAILGSLKISIGKFATAGEDAGEAFTRALTDIAAVETEAEAAALALDTVGSRAMADFAAAVREGRFDIEDFQEALKSNTDTITEAARASETTGDRMAILWNKTLKALMPLGEALLSMVDEVIGWAENIGKLAGEIAKLFEETGKAAEKWIPDWIKDGSLDKLNAGIGNLIFAISNPKLFKEAQRLAQQAHEMAPAMEAWWKQAAALPARLDAVAAATKKAADETEDLGGAAEEAAEGTKELGESLKEVEEIVPPLIANITNLFAVINRGIEEDALRGMREFLDFLAQGARMGTTGAFFGTGGGGTVIGGGLLDFFGKELPQTFVRGWNLVVGPALAKLPPQTKSSLSADMGAAFIDGFQGAMKNIQDIWKATVVGLGQAFSVALSKELGTGFWGTFLSSVGGSLISSAIGFIFGGGKKVDLGLPTFAEAQELLAEKAREAAEALASIKDEIADTNVSIFRAKLSLDEFRDALQEARQAQRDATKAIKAVGDEFAIAQQRTFRLTGGGAKTEIVGTLTGGEALAELQRLIDAAIGTGKLGFISRREQKEILELVQGTENEILAKQLVEAAAATALIRADFELQKLQLKNLRKARQFARDTLMEMTSIEEAVRKSGEDIVQAIENIPRFQTGTRFVPQTGLAIVHRGEQIIPPRGERGAAGIDAGGGMPTTLIAHINIDGKRIETVIVPIAVAGMEDAIASRETSIRVNTRERRG